MSRIVLALVFAVAMSAAATAGTVQFAVDGVPTDGSVPIEVVPSQQVEIGVYITPDFELESFLVDFYPTGPWAPLPQVDGEDIGPAGSGLVGLPNPPWDQGLSDAKWLDMFAVWEVGGFISTGDLFSQPGLVAFFNAVIPDVAESTILNLEFDFAELSGPIGGGYDDAPNLLPLSLHVTPEPATLALLALGGLAALRRRFA